MVESEKEAGQIHCTYCKDNKCRFKDIINCKHRELMEEVKNQDASIQDKILEISRLDSKISKLEEALKPILDIDLDSKNGTEISAWAMKVIEAVQESKRLHLEAVEND